MPPDEPSVPAGTQPLRSAWHKLSPVPFPDIPPGRRAVWGDAVPAPCPVHPRLSLTARNKLKAQIPLPSPGKGGDGREALASSRSFSASISSAASRTVVTGPPTNLLSPAFPGIAAAAGSPPAAFPATLQGLAAHERGVLAVKGGIFREEEKNQSGPDSPRAALMGSWLRYTLRHTRKAHRESSGQINLHIPRGLGKSPQEQPHTEQHLHSEQRARGLNAALQPPS